MTTFKDELEEKQLFARKSIQKGITPTGGFLASPEFTATGAQKTRFKQFAGEREEETQPQQPATQQRSQMYDAEIAKEHGALSQLFEETRYQPQQDAEQLRKITKLSAIADGLSLIAQSYFVTKGAEAIPYDPSGTARSMDRYRQQVAHDEMMEYQDKLREIQAQMDKIDMLEEKAKEERKMDFELEKQERKMDFELEKQEREHVAKRGVEEMKQQEHLDRVKKQIGSRKDISRKDRDMRWQIAQLMHGAKNTPLDRELYRRENYIDITRHGRHMGTISEGQAYEVFGEVHRQQQPGGELGEGLVEIRRIMEMLEGGDRPTRDIIQKIIADSYGQGSPTVDRLIERALREPGKSLNEGETIPFYKRELDVIEDERYDD